MKKVFSLFMALVGIASLASCGGGNEGGGEDLDTPTTKVVKMWLHKSEAEDEGKVYSAVADLFNEGGYKTPDGKKELKVKLEFKNSSDTLNTAIQAEVLSGGLPDIVAVDAPTIAAYADTGILTDVSKYVSADERAEFVDSVIEQSTYKGGLYALSPMDAPTGLYYNHDLLKQVGYKASDFGTPENPWSWVDTMNAMKKLKEKGLPYQIKLNLGFGGDEGVMYIYSPLVYSAGGDFVGEDGKVKGHLDSEKSIAGIKSIEQFFEVDAEGKNWCYTGSNTDALASGECAFEVFGPWNVSTIQKNYKDFVDKYGIMPMPVYEAADGTKGKAVAGCGSWGFGVTSHSRDVEAAAEVLKFFAGKTASELLYQSIGTFPTNKQVLAENEDFQKGQLKQLADILDKCATPRPKLVNYPKLSAEYSNIIEAIETLYGTEDYDLVSFIKTSIKQIDKR